MSQTVRKVWRNFVHSYSVTCCGLLCCRTLEGQAFFQEPESTPASTKPLHKHQYICRHIVKAHFPSWLIRFWHRVLWLLLAIQFLWVEISTMAYETNSSCWPERLSVAYCTHIIQTKLMPKNQRYPQKSTFTATEGPTHMPLVMPG